MESLKLRKQFNTADYLLAFLVLLFIYTPLFISIFSWSSSLDRSLLSSDFFKLIFHSIYFCLGQSFLSTILTAIISVFLSLSLSLSPPKWTQALYNLIDQLGLFFFLIPQISIALLIIFLGQKISYIPSSGWWAVVIAHFTLNVLFVSSQINHRLYSWIHGEGSDVFLLLKTLSMKNSKRLFYFFYAPVKDELKTWLPMVFFWSSTAFATVLILGGHPRNSSPEHLLFYSIAQDPQGSRTLFLFFLQVALGLAILKFAQVKVAVQKRSYVSHQLREFSTPLIEKKRSLIFSLVLVFSLLSLVVLFIGPILYNFIWQNPFSQIHNNFYLASIYSTILAAGTTGITVLLSYLFIFTNSFVRTLIWFSAAFSPAVVSSSWIYLGLDQQFTSFPVFSLILASLLIALMSFPFFSIWLNNSQKSADQNLLLFCQSLGMKKISMLRYFWTPHLKPLLKKIIVICFVSTFGEIVISSLFVKEIPLLSVLGRMASSRYDFQTGNAVLIIIFLVTILMSTLLFNSWKGENKLWIKH